MLVVFAMVATYGMSDVVDVVLVVGVVLVVDVIVVLVVDVVVVSPSAWNDTRCNSAGALPARER